VARLAGQARPVHMIEQPPEMFDRPTEAPPPLVPVQSSEHVTTMHMEWARRDVASTAKTSPWRRVIRKTRSTADRMLGRADNQMMGDLIRAIDAVAVRCDELSDRVARQEILIADMASSLGQELTRLRAVVAHDMPPHTDA
jgi:hypothetical protein